MSQKIPLYYSLPAIILSALVATTIVLAWTEPSQAPTGGNAPAPLNVSSASQYKSGALGIGGLLRGYSNAIFDGNVGIGTVNPSQKLDVAGYVKGTGLCIGNDCRTSWPSIVTRFVSSDCGETTRTCPIGYTTVSTWHVGYSGDGYCLWNHYTDDAGSRKDGWVSLCVKQ